MITCRPLPAQAALVVARPAQLVAGPDGQHSHVCASRLPVRVGRAAKVDDLAAQRHAPASSPTACT